MEAEPLRVLDQLDARSPRVEDEGDLEQPRHVAHHRAVVEALQADAAAAHADGLELGHLGGQIRVREADVVDARALAAARGRLRNEHELHAVARRGVVAVGDRLAAQVLDVPFDAPGRTRRRDLHVVEVGRQGGARRRGDDCGGHESESGSIRVHRGTSCPASARTRSRPCHMILGGAIRAGMMKLRIGGQGTTVARASAGERRRVPARAAGRAVLAVCLAACGAAGTVGAQTRDDSPAAGAASAPRAGPGGTGPRRLRHAARDRHRRAARPGRAGRHDRDAAGRTTVRAIRLAAGIRLDGILDEEVYRSVLPITDFLQQVPVEGAPATERTEAWILFDDTNVYVSARVHDSAPESEWIANEMRRDTSQLRQNDTFTVFFDTFYDRRNGYNFYTNPLGARADQQFTNEGNPNGDWNPVWDVRTGRFDGGWTVEMEIPFKTLRYRSGSPQLWGVQMRRSVRRKNEWTYLTRLPISAGAAAARRASSASRRRRRSWDSSRRPPAGSSKSSPTPSAA